LSELETDPVYELSALESMRRAIEALDHQTGNLYDYLDKGRPDGADKEEAERRISEYDSLSENTMREYVKHITRLRRERPELLEQWVSGHISRLDGLVPEIGRIAASELERNTLLFVMESLKKRWNGVLSGDDNPVVEHSAFCSSSRP
jgi:hypothetical protein